MTRRLLAPLAAILITSLAVGNPALRAQDWKTAALASFDDVWQTVNDTLVDPTAGGLDWTAVGAEFRPKVEAAGSANDARAVITSMLERLHRSHFRLLTASVTADDPPVTGDAIVPIEIRPFAGSALGFADDVCVVVTRVDGTPAPNGVHPGDVIRKIDQIEVSTLVKSVAALADERARHLELLKRATRALYGPDRSTATLVVERSGATQMVSAARSRPAGQVVQLGNLPPLRVRVDARATRTPAKKDVGVIAFNIWMTAVDPQVAAAVDKFRKADGIVIDLRGNPGGLAGMIRGVAGHFFGTPVLLGSSKTRDAELQFRANPRLVSATSKPVVPFGGPVAILVDELTGSASECFAAAMQDLKRARVFGRTTMGEALPAQTKRLANGDVLMYAIGDFVTSTGRRVEGGGVVPDEAVPPSIVGFATGGDGVLDAALAWIDRQKR